MKTLRQKISLGVNPQVGFSLIEVLVALLVLSIGLLGLAMLQVQGMKFNSDAYFRTQATILAYDMIDRMRSNHVAAGLGAYDLGTATAISTKLSAYNSCKASSCNCDNTACSTATDVATYDIGKWYEAQDLLLPGSAISRSTIERAGNAYTITIRWWERELQITQTWKVAL
jgi:type IV pilus assembly protein PilV